MQITPRLIMDLPVGIYVSIFILFSLYSNSVCSQLYMEPSKDTHGYFTGDNFFITCFTTADSTLSWSDGDGNRIEATEGSLHVQKSDSNENGLRLVFTNVEKHHAGTYTCSDDQGSISFELIVYRSISFTDTQRDQHAAEGQTGIVMCNTHSDSKVNINWYFNGSKIAASEKYNISGNHLTIHNLTRADAGIYKCSAFVITALISQVKDLDITLHVQYAPEINGDHHVVSFASISSVKNLTCSVSADPPPMFEWLRDDMEIDNGTEDRLIFNSEDSSVLQLTVDSEDKLGEYICQASNPMGQKEVVIELKGGETPPAPEVSVVGEEQGVVKLEIKADDAHKNDELRITGYKVEYILASETWDAANIQEFEIGESYVLRNTSFNTDYIIRAAAVNAAGYGPFSEEVKYATHALQTASVIGRASGLVSSSLVLAISIIFFRLF
ncbi:neural cell adhesion molecule 1-like [Stegodyphus dumicola]|uniref:neural cell adhesion molecule 1-like n=1 Tax=Stegodyphus dumicola TaxID=202533 RepID=UPI0015AB33CC|nr:neural cell adhesion molecule 1-like [Stegodyphus dumicola]